MGIDVRTVARREARLRKLNILIATDAWRPQVNGVVRTLEMTARELERLGHAVHFATPEEHATIPLPTYGEIRLALFPRRNIRQQISRLRPDAIHISTEGPIGLAARNVCLELGLPFTTAFHTHFPGYVRARLPFVSERAVFAALKRFHAPGRATMVSTRSLKAELERHGFGRTKLWSRGVDVERFRPGARDAFERLGLRLPRPIFLYVGRIAIEKNLDAFLALDLPGSKVVIGDGPQRCELARRFPAAHFLGARSGDELARCYAASDVFVFPSRTDTYGLVLLEALACGLPVAAFPVPGPLDVLGPSRAAVLDEDLRSACLDAMRIPAAEARAFAMQHSWESSAEQFVENLALIDGAFDQRCQLARFAPPGVADLAAA
jgi:glycosyltransferase involved in cell wall biosynthesis